MTSRALSSLALLVLVLPACEESEPTEPNPQPAAEARLVFATFDISNGAWGAGLAEADGSDMRAIPLRLENPNDDPPDVSIHHVQWSPDGRRIAYRASYTGNDNWYLVLSDTAGSFKRLLTSPGGYMEGALWSPRGDRLLYHWGGFVGGQAGLAYQTAIVDTLGNERDFFIPADGELFDGDRVFFGLLAWPDSSGPLPALYDAAWAPDGEHLYVAGAIGRRPWDPDLERVELFRVSAETGAIVERVTDNDVPEWRFRLSPDGRFLLLPIPAGAWPEHPDGGAFVMPVGGQATDLELVVLPPTLLDEPIWASDSRHLTFTRPLGAGGYPAVFVYDLVTGTESRTDATGYWPHLFVPRD